MAQFKKQNYTKYYQADSLARTLSPERREKPITREEIQIKRNRERNQSMSLPYVLCLIAVVGATFFICLNYLNVKNSVSGSLRNIAKLENQYEDLKLENLALEHSIDSYEDYARIYDIATNELGMQPASADQVITFDLEESEYVKQYESIPE